MSKAPNMTAGSPARLILMLALPMVAGNLLQQLFYIAESVLVGRFVGKEALAAMGAALPILNPVLNFIIGGCVGVSVVIASLLGAGDTARIKTLIAGSLLWGGIFCAGFTALCVALTDPVLKLTGVPMELYAQTRAYLTVAISSVLFAFICNFCFCAMRAMGDSRTPFLIQLAGILVNLLLDLLLVVRLSMGLWGSAWALFVTNAAGAVFCLWYTRRAFPLFAVGREDLRADRELTMSALRYGALTAFQYVSFHMGKLVIQRVINGFGTDTIAAYNAGTRIDTLIFNITSTIGAAVTTYSAQNQGAGLYGRIRAGFKQAVMLSEGYCVFVSALVLLFAGPIVGIFVPAQESAVVAIGAEYLTLMAILYPLAGMGDAFQGLSRGTGWPANSLVVTWIQMFFRIWLSFTLAPRLGAVAVAWATGVGWIAVQAYHWYYYKRYVSDPRSLQTAREGS
jgi:putative MATE family efflux protein